MASEKKERFHDATEDELRELVECAVPRNTKRATNFWMALFDDFCNEKSIRCYQSQNVWSGGIQGFSLSILPRASHEEW